MKRFIIISMLASLAIQGWACFGYSTHNYFLFSTYNRQDFQWRMNELSENNWKEYLGKTSAPYYYFDAQEVIDFAKKKNDLLMVSYVENLEQYLKCADALQESWDYPSKEEIAANQRKLASIRAYAMQKLGSRLRSQHGLLVMRCNMMLGRHKDNVEFWEQKGSNYIESVYKELMKNIYAGALLKTGRQAEAMSIFVEQGDARSLMACYYDKRSMAAISKEYHRDANSPVLPFLVQDFVNNVQDCLDDNMPGKLFVRDIKREEALQMCQLCDEVVSEGKTTQPALWKSAQAWIHYLLGSRQQAKQEIDKAVNMDGTDRIRDNARAIRLYITAAQSASNKQLDSYLAKELEWLEGKMQEERLIEQGYNNHYVEVYDRLVNQVLVEKYGRVQRLSMAAAFLGVADEQEKIANPDIEKARQRKSDYRWNPDYSDSFFAYLDTMKVDDLVSYYHYINSKGENELDRWLISRVRHDENFLKDLIGTKYLRRGEWKNAITWLEQVSLAFINTQNITPYAIKRSYQVEPWLKKQPLNEEELMQENLQARTNQKLDFAREMLQLENGYFLMQGAQRCQRAYDLAVRYYQASFRGDAWYLTRYGQSCMDEQRSDEIDFAGITVNLLTTAKQATSFPLKEKALFALAYVPTDAWYTNDWDDKTYEYVKHFHKQSRQYLALKELSGFAKQNAARVSPFVSRCDVLKQFVKVER